MGNDSNNPTRVNRGQPPKGWKRRFIEELSARANVTDACRVAKVSRPCAYRYRESDPKFAARWDEAMQSACDALEREAWRRAVEGTDEPVFYKGDECGHIRRYSDTLMVLLLKSNRPEKYRESYDAAKKLSELLTAAQRYTIPDADDRPEPEDAAG